MNKKILISFIIVLVLSTMLIVVGALFKLQHWPGAGPLLVTGMVGEIVALGLGLLFVVKLISKKTV